MKKSAAFALLLAARSWAHAAEPFPFFAMDTVFRGNPTGEILDVAKASGYAGVGGTLGSADAVKATVRDCDARGLQVFAVYASATLTREALAIQPAAFDVMPVLKARGTILWVYITAGQNVASSSVAGDAIAVPVLRAFAEAAAANGLRVALYPHRGDWTERIQDAVRVARKVDRPNLGVGFNLCHCLMVGDEAKIPDLLAEAAPNIFVVTINGADAGAAGTSWGRLIQLLDQGSYDVGLVRITKHFFAANKPIASVCHGVEIPAYARCVQGRRMATVAKYQFDLEVCGGIYVDAAGVVDGNLVSGRTYRDNGHYLGPWIKMLEAVRVAGSDSRAPK
ncbi:MAG: hypothetical protein EXS38_02430 [Opitutus sp.]|nr:hypothetical protein [Opitutus sp.]